MARVRRFIVVALASAALLATGVHAASAAPTSVAVADSNLASDQVYQDAYWERALRQF